MMKKLLYIGGFDLPDKNAACHRAISNSKLFKMVGISSSLLGISKESNFESGVVRNLGFKDEIEMMAVKYPQGSIDWLRFIFGDKATIAYIKENKPDTVVIYNYPAIASIRIHKICKAYGIEVISDITEWYSSANKSLLRQVVKWIDTSLRIKFVARLNNRIITTSQYMTNIYESKGHTCLELPTLFDSEYLSSNATRSRKSEDSDKIKLIYFGSPFDKSVAIYDNRQVKERLDKVISAVSDNYIKSNIYLNVYGITKSDFLEVYPNYISTLEKMGDNVVFHGRVPHNELISYISESDYSIFFRDDTRVNKAGFPSKLAESLTLGIPVITNEISSLKKYQNVAGVNFCSTGNESLELGALLSKRQKVIEIDTKHFDYRSYKEDAKKFFVSNEV
ncbi:glycosyltransferase [Vibrio vulnificus]|uniref:glycosyltransferase n=2 Tax=Vibrio vulnificus TaxID=672 RepID=UPI0029B4BFC4|nr:glycosyltransferase [Vibrio vulnificus]ELV8623054.1 glycosyltransferase [Vibrio vulnificus]